MTCLLGLCSARIEGGGGFKFCKIITIESCPKSQSMRDTAQTLKTIIMKELVWGRIVPPQYE